MKISIVTISYNQIEYIEETIKSIVEQNYSNLEYIVVDPGSTDGSRELIQQYKKAITKTIFEPDKGQADGLNKGFCNATGDILGFVNSDDILLPGALKNVNDFFCVHPHVDVLMGNGIIIDSKNNRIKKIYVDTYSINRFSYGCVTFIQPSVFFRRQAFEKVGGFNINNRTCWDGELMLDFGIAKCKIRTTSQCLSGFRLHDQSISSKGVNPAYLAELDRMFEKVHNRKYMWYDNFIYGYYKLTKIISNPTKFFYKINKSFLSK